MDYRLFYLLLVPLLILILLFWLPYFFVRKVVPDKYEWLQVMSDTEWKRARKIAGDTLKLKTRKSVPGVRKVIYNDLKSLINERLVECRPIQKVGGELTMVYKLTEKGLKKRNSID